MKRALGVIIFTLGWVALAFLMIAIVGWGAGITPAEYARIDRGMTLDEVVELLGNEPSEVVGRPWAFTASWRGPNMAVAEITFVSGRVSGKNWRSPLERFLD
jgi:hypothetical protein